MGNASVVTPTEYGPCSLYAVACPTTSTVVEVMAGLVVAGVMGAGVVTEGVSGDDAFGEASVVSLAAEPVGSVPAGVLDRELSEHAPVVMATSETRKWRREITPQVAMSACDDRRRMQSKGLAKRKRPAER